MLELGVRLEDRGDDSIWKLEDPAVLRREQQAKQQAAAEQKYKKALAAHSKKQAVRSIAHLLTMLLLAMTLHMLTCLQRCCYINRRFGLLSGSQLLL